MSFAGHQRERRTKYGEPIKWVIEAGYWSEDLTQATNSGPARGFSLIIRRFNLRKSTEQKFTNERGLEGKYDTLAPQNGSCFQAAMLLNRRGIGRPVVVVRRYLSVRPRIGSLPNAPPKRGIASFEGLHPPARS
jgi:hypothetical protein